MKTKMIRAVIAAICIAAALPSWAADGRLVSPVYSMGLFDPSSPTSSTPILQTSRLAFKGITLDELKAVDGAYEGYLLKWGTEAGTLATRNANAKFALDAESAQKYQLIANGTGLLLRPRCGLMVIVR